MLKTPDHEAGLLWPPITLDLSGSKVHLLCLLMGIFRFWQGAQKLDLGYVFVLMLPALLTTMMRSNYAAWLGLSCSMYLIATRHKMPNSMRSGALILGACGLQVVISPFVGGLYGGELLANEAQIAAWILSLFSPAITIDHTTLYIPGGYPIVLVWGCSFFANLSVILLLWYSATLFFLGRMGTSMLICGALVSFITFASNSARIAAMVYDPRLYNALHQGVGEIILRLAVLGLVSSVIALFVLRQRNVR